MKFLLPVACALALSACAFLQSPEAPAPVAPVYQRVDIAGETATAAERAACDAVGGSISRAGLLGREHCLQTYPDAGKVCSGESDCIGTCRYEADGTAMGKTATGTCQVTDVPFGCYAMVEGGVVSPVLCVD
jgi:hypothetical protein